MRILISILALTSAFFVPESKSLILDLDDLRSPKGELGFKTICRLASTNQILHEHNSTTQLDIGAIRSRCTELAMSYLDKGTDSNCPASLSSIQRETRTEVYSSIYEQDFNGTCQQVGSDSNQAKYFDAGPTDTYSCPPPNSPKYEHVVPIPNATEEPTFKCAKIIEDCPAGYHSRAVSKALGSTAACMPKECPPAGSGESLYTSPNLGTSFSGAGMYCNDGCAYSISASNITSEKHATGTSQGAACGDKPYDNKKLADEIDSDKCSTATNGEVTILSCSATPTTPEKESHNNDDSKVPKTDVQPKPKENCLDGDSACNLRNIETELENNAALLMENDNQLHNKKIDADTKNTKAILNVMESVDTSIFLQTKQDERLSAVTISKFNELIDAVNGIETGGSGGGGGGNGSGTGGDCEGSPSECVPVEGAEIPSETVNLNQYADKYDDWLPNAELPSEKCIVLTNGKSICLSFEAFILLFQGISGLLVIGALMHSAKIISGAI